TDSRVIFAGHVDVTNLITITKGTLDFNGEANQLTGTGLTMMAETELRIATESTIANIPQLLGPYSLASGSLIKFDANNESQNIVTSITYQDVYFTNGGDKNIMGNLVIEGDLTISGTAQLDVTSNNHSVNIAGNWNISSTDIDPFVEQNGLVTFDGENQQTITHTGTESFHDLAIDSSSTLITNGASDTIKISGDWTNNGTFSSQTGIIYLAGTDLQKIQGVTNFNDLTLNNTGEGAIIQNGSISVAGILTLSDGLFTTGNLLTLSSDINGTASLAEITNGGITGSVTVERYLDLPNSKWRDITSPVQNSTLSDWQDDFITAGYPGATGVAAGFISIYNYDESIDGGNSDGGWVSPTSSSDITTMKGNSVYLALANYTIDVTGPVNSGTIAFNNTSTPDITFTANSSPVDPDQDGWNYIGNPYPCAINWNKISNTDRSNIKDQYWIYNPEFGTFGSYISGASDGSNGIDSIIPSSQAFWIHATASPPSLTIRESTKSLSNKAFIKSQSNDSTPSIKLSLSSSINNYRDETLIFFKIGSSHNIGDRFDGLRLESYEEEAPIIATISAEGHDLTFNQVTDSLKNLVIPLKASSSIASDHIITVEYIKNFDDDTHVFLRDNETGSIYEMQNLSSFNFLLSEEIDLVRFDILFNLTDRDKNETIIENTIYPNPNDGSFNLYIPGIIKKTELDISDVTGRIIYRKTIISNSTDITLKEAKPGVYFLKTHSINGSEIKKMIIE
ncbi:MAG: T9SS type A sorting domain-containing protein, partial [Flavobacteriales bacterium]|nr:T9SS type A sorting domain-containing protein [Flavobacteriales bacterium]